MGRTVGRSALFLIIFSVSPEVTLAQGPDTATSGGSSTEPGAKVQTGAGTTDATTTGSSGADEEAEAGQPGRFACFEIDQAQRRERCFRALTDDPVE